MLAGRMTLATIAVAAACAAAPAGALARPPAPTITAKPSSAMINTDVLLRGSGFASHTTLTLRECGRVFWLSPASPCDTTGEVSVKTGARGTFKTKFTVQLCPEGEPLEVITQRRCYIGVPRFGEDTGSLEPAAALAVSYP